MDLFKNQFRIESARLKDWDYSTPWWYYVTINTKDHVSYFGEIIKSKIRLNDFGEFVNREWIKSKEIREHIDLDYFIIMPNHLHGIVIINEPMEIKSGVVETHRHASQKFSNREENKSVRNSLSNIIRGFKSSVTTWARKNGYPEFNWQSRFFDHIIRNQEDLFRIRKYMENNPLRWDTRKND